MKKFISLIYDQIFIESIDLSSNPEISEDLAQFAIKYFDAFDIESANQFRFLVPRMTKNVRKALQTLERSK